MRGQSRKTLRVLPEVLVLIVMLRISAAGAYLSADEAQLLCVLDLGKRIEHNRVRPCHYRGDRGNSKREGEDHYQGDPRRFSQLAKSVTKIPKHLVSTLQRTLMDWRQGISPLRPVETSYVFKRAQVPISCRERQDELRFSRRAFALQKPRRVGKMPLRSDEAQTVFQRDKRQR